jgi:hypothetical protein
MKKIIKLTLNNVFWVISCSLFAFSFYLQRLFMSNFDENDHIAAGYFMSLGEKLYTNIFSHHFPFPYYWIGFFSPLWNTDFSRSLSIFRLSLLLLYLISFVLIYLSLKNKITKYAFSLWIILLSFFFTLYHGNLNVSESYAALAIISCFWIVFPVTAKLENSSKLKVGLTILFAFIGFWTQPLLFPLFLLPFLITQKKHWLKLLVIIAGVNLIPILFFLINGQLKEFIEQGIWFNFKIYPKYYYSLDDRQIYFSNSQLLNNAALFLFNEYKLLTQFSSPLEIFQFFVNLSSIIITIALIAKKKWKELTVFVILLLTSRTRENKLFPGVIFNFGIYPFLTLSTGILIFYLAKSVNFVKTILAVLPLILLSFLSSKPIFEQSLKPGYNYHVFWSYRQEIGKELQTYAQGQPVLVYPHDPDLYFFAQSKKIDRFLYYFPWTNDVEKYRQERLDALENNPPPIFYAGELSFLDDKYAYKKFFPELFKNYTKIEKDGNIYIRNDLLDTFTPNT